MKRWLLCYTIFSVLAYTLPASLTVSMLQIGNFFSHFHDHHGDPHDHNIFKFIASHYINGKHHDADHENHQNLPFHNHDNSTQTNSFQTLSLLPQHLSYVAATGLIHNSIIQTTPSSRITSSFLGDIWQPPKV
jgi:hypothetical protein